MKKFPHITSGYTFRKLSGNRWRCWQTKEITTSTESYRRNKAGERERNENDPDFRKKAKKHSRRKPFYLRNKAGFNRMIETLSRKPEIKDDEFFKEFNLEKSFVVSTFREEIKEATKKIIPGLSLFSESFFGFNLNEPPKKNEVTFGTLKIYEGPNTNTTKGWF